MICERGEGKAFVVFHTKAHILKGSINKIRSTELLKVPGYLPLAITQAAAYISENSIMVDEYLKLIYAEDSEIQVLLNEDLPDLRRDFDLSS